MNFRLLVGHFKRYSRVYYSLGIASVAAACTGAVCFGPMIGSQIVRSSLSGALSALTVEILCHPIDTFNMRAKARSAPLGWIRDFSSRTAGATGKRVAGPKLVRRLGAQLRDLGRISFKGVSYVVLGYPMCLVLYYLVYQSSKDFMQARTVIKSEGAASGAAATISETIFILLMYPFERKKTCAQTGKCGMGEVGLIDFLYPRTSPVRKGFDWTRACALIRRQMYAGMVSYMVTYVVFVGLQFYIYNLAMHYCRHRNSPESSHSEKPMAPSTPEIFVASTISAVVASVASNPFEQLTVLNQTGQRMSFRELWGRRKIWFTGLRERVAYNVAMCCALFYLLEHSAAWFGVQFSH